MKPIYEPKGAAKEYGDLAINIYTGCPHRCFYCYAPTILHKNREIFHTHVEPRPGIVEEVRKQVERENIIGKLIHLCFTCDPYPTGYDTTPTREIIKILKEAGNHVQILTKGDGRRDFDLLDSDDWYGITIDGITGKSVQALAALYKAHVRGIKTWVSFEPVVNDKTVLSWISILCEDISGDGRGSRIADKIKIGKLNYFPSDINWSDFGHRAEELCRKLGVDYYIKDSLRKEMEKNENP